MTTDRRIVRSVRRVPTAVKNFGKSPRVLEMPYLIQMSRDSYHRFLDTALRDLFDEISPIEDFPGGRFELGFQEHYFEEPKHSEEECREAEITYSAPLYVTVQLRIKAQGPGQGEIKQQTLFVGDIPMMTKRGTFIINGAERVVVSQLVPVSYTHLKLQTILHV